MVYSNGRSSHVLLPSITTRFSATACSFFASKSSTDLGAWCRDINVYYSAIGTFWTNPLKQTGYFNILFYVLKSFKLTSNMLPMFWVNRLEDKPCGTSLFHDMASWTLSVFKTYTMGAKHSSWISGLSCLRPVTIVGSTKYPGLFSTWKRPFLKIQVIHLFFYKTSDFFYNNIWEYKTNLQPLFHLVFGDHLQTLTPYKYSYSMCNSTENYGVVICFIFQKICDICTVNDWWYKKRFS